MDVTSDNYTEQLVFFYVIKNYEMASIYKPEYFAQDRLKTLFKVVQPYINDYREEPSEEMVCKLIALQGLQTDMTTDIIHTLWETRKHLGQYSDEWLKMTAKGYAEWNNFVGGVNRMHSYMMTTQYDITPETAHEYVEKVKTMFASDTTFTMSDSIGHDFFDPEEHIKSIVETRTTGYKFFDLCLNGGLARKTFNVIMGPPKVGKSMWLCNICANSVLNGDNCCYITLEMSSQMVNQRIGANILNIPIRDYDKYAKDTAMMTEKMRNLYTSSFIKPGALVVEEFPTSSATIYDIEAFIINAEKARSTPDKPFKFRNIYIDYVNIMADAKHANSENSYQKIKNISEDIRAFAQRGDYCVVSLTQTNRNGMNASDYDMTAVSESSGLTATVDSLFGIICTTMMRAAGVYYIKALALRSSNEMGSKKRYNFQGDYLRITEDPNEDIIPENIPLPEDLTQGANNLTGNNNNGNKNFASKQKQWTPKQNENAQPMIPNDNVVQNHPSSGVSLGALETNGISLFI